MTPTLAMGLTLVVSQAQPGPTLDQLAAQLKRVGSQIEHVAMVRGVSLERDAARFTLKEGSLYLLGPVAGRRVAMVFVGSGALELTPPLAVERNEIRRLLGDTTLSGEFGGAVFVFADSTAEELSRQVEMVPVAQAKDHPVNRRQVPGRVGEALDFVIDADSHQIDSGLLSALLNGAPNPWFSAYLVRTGKESLFLVHEAYDPEGISVYRKGKYQGQRTQTVTGFPRIGDLDDSSGNGPSYDPLELRGYRIESTIRANLGYSATTLIRMAPRVNGQRWFQFWLSSLLDVDSITNVAGRPLRYHRPSNRSSLWIELDSTARAGVETQVRLSYHGDLLATGSLARQFLPRPSAREPSDFMINDRWVFLKETYSWFPRRGNEATDFSLIFHTPADLEFATIGKQVSRKASGKVLTTEWASEVPARNVSFNIGDFEELKITDPRIPPVTVQVNAEAHRQMQTAFLGQRDPASQVGSDVANSLAFFSRVFGPPLYGQYFATEIPYGHGEAFPGLIHLSWWTFQTIEEKGESEVFRAHEMAHQWWGIGVQPKGYRDRWLSEGFSDFSGLWYMQLILRDNEKYFKQLADSRKKLLALKDAPPLGLGTRVAMANPEAYAPIVYEKGAWILHMIRNLMLNLRTMNEDVFEATMADFYQTYRGKQASTADFQAIVEKHMGQGMSWFFKEWFDDGAYPTYILSWVVEKGADGKEVLRLRVRQEGVSEDFFMPVPLKIEFADGQSVMIRVLVKGTGTTADLPVPLTPVRLELNPLESVLARVKEEAWKPDK